MTGTLSIIGGTVVTLTGLGAANICVRDGKIESLGDERPAMDNEIDARGLFVLPGGVDIHTHIDTAAAPGLRSPDDWNTGTLAAACGGLTTVVDYVRQQPDESLLAAMGRWRARAAASALIDYAFHAVPHTFDERTIEEFRDLVTAGFPSVKIFMSRVPYEAMVSAMTMLSSCGGIAMVHAEDAAIREAAYERLRREGRATARAWSEARPREGERVAVLNAIDACAGTGCPTYLVHLSCAESVEAVRSAKARGLPIWAETRPCYLLLTEERYRDPSPRYLMFTGYPPLRRADDVEALWDGIADGTIDVIGSDHLSWAIDQKLVGDTDLDALPVGLPALETEVRAIFSAGVSARRIGIERFVEIMATTPARIAGLYPKKGGIAVGSDADFVLIDPTRSETIRSANMHGGAGYEPLDGLECRGWPVMTISRGEVVCEDGDPVGRPGRGRHLPRPRFDASAVRDMPVRAAADHAS